MPVNDETREMIAAALKVRKATLDACPINHPKFGSRITPERCPKCKATASGPCWVNVRADAAFVDAIQEMMEMANG